MKEERFEEEFLRGLPVKKNQKGSKKMNASFASNSTSAAQEDNLDEDQSIDTRAYAGNPGDYMVTPSGPLQFKQCTPGKPGSFSKNKEDIQMRFDGNKSFAAKHLL